MQDCIYSQDCTEYICDRACPTLAETSYLLERNKISLKNKVFKMTDFALLQSKSYINNCSTYYRLIVKTSELTSSFADCITYAGICKFWEGSQLSTAVYNLRYARYIELLRGSWATKRESEELEYFKIFSCKSNILIISGMDFVNFRDFECQTLLLLLQNRLQDLLSTIIVLPKTELVGSGDFFDLLHKQLKEVKR